MEHTRQEIEGAVDIAANGSSHKGEISDILHSSWNRCVVRGSTGTPSYQLLRAAQAGILLRLSEPDQQDIEAQRFGARCVAMIELAVAVNLGATNDTLAADFQRFIDICNKTQDPR